MPEVTSNGSPMEVVEHPFAYRVLEVKRTRWLTRRMLQVTLTGDELPGFCSDAADDGARLYVPPDPTDRSWRPVLEGRKLVFPGEQVPGNREYTPRRYDAETNELDIDFVVHGDGPISAWAANAVPGHLLCVSGPRRSRMITGNVDWYLLAGDESAIPSISRRLEELPAGMTAYAFFEVADEGERQPIDSPANVEVSWLYRNEHAPDPNLLAGAIGGLTFPPGEVYAWAAGEASAMRAVRRHLLNERGLSLDRIRITGYWKRSIPNWDHHLPLDEE